MAMARAWPQSISFGGVSEVAFEFDRDGSLDTSFRDPDLPFGVARSVAGKKQSSFHAVVELPDGRVIAGGCVGVSNPGEQFALFRFVP